MSSSLKYETFGSLLKNVVDNRGKTCPTADSGIPLIATNCIVNNYLYPIYEKVRYITKETYKTWFRDHPKPGDMIFVLKGTPGRVAWVPDPVDFCIAQDMVAIRADERKIFPKYLFAVLRLDTIQQEIEGLHVGSLIPHFKKGDFDELKIPIVEPKLQEFIGNQYFDLSLKIDLLHRQNKTLEALAETLFRQWFVEEAEEGWEITTFSEHTEVFRGLSYKGSGLSDGSTGIPMHNLNSVYEGGGYKSEGIKYYNGEFKDRHIVKPGEIIVTNTEQGHEFRLIGFPAVVPNYFGDFGIFSQHIYKLSVIERTYLTSQFLYYLIMTPKVREQIIGATNGSTVNMLAIDGLQRTQFSLPPKDKVMEFSKLIKLYWKKKGDNQIQIRTLTRLRDTLLPKLMSGEVRVKI